MTPQSKPIFKQDIAASQQFTKSVPNILCQGRRKNKTSTSFTTHRREGTVRVPRPQPQRKEAKSTPAECVTGMGIATSLESVQPMAKNAYTVVSGITLQGCATKDKVPEPHQVAHPRDHSHQGVVSTETTEAQMSTD